MNVLIDSNVVIDVYQNRAGLAEKSSAILKLSESGKLNGFFSVSQLTDVFFLLKQHFKEKDTPLALLKKLFTLVRVCEVTPQDATATFELPMNDFEDALIAVVANRLRAEFIITRNIKHFKKSPVKAITPDDFLAMFFPEA